jgi:hypothetical protein
MLRYTVSEISSRARYDHTCVTPLRHFLEVTRSYIQHAVGTKISIPKIMLNAQGLFFHKVGYSRCDVPSEMFYMI